MIPTSAYNDNDLLLKVANGDEKAFEYLYTKHIEFLYGFILKYVKSPNLAEDLAQDTFIRIWEKKEQLEGVNSFKDYLFIAGRNLTFNFLKKASRENVAIGEILRHYQQSSSTDDDSLLMKEYNQFIQKVLQSLPAQTREVFQLCREQNRSYDEVAALLGISRNTVKKHMVRSHKSFTDLMGKNPNLPFLLLLVLLQKP